MLAIIPPYCVRVVVGEQQARRYNEQLQRTEKSMPSFLPVSCMWGIIERTRLAVGNSKVSSHLARSCKPPAHTPPNFLL